MELELLKEIWKETDNQHATFASADTVSKKTSSFTQLKIVSVLKRNLFVEVIIMLICAAAIAIFYFVAFKGTFSEVSWMYIILAVFFLLYYYRKNELLKSLQQTSMNVKANLEFQVAALEKYIRFYLVAGTVLVPVLLAFFYILLFYKHIPLLPSLQNQIGSENFVLVYIIFSFFFTVALYYPYRWYIYNLYGKHIDKFKALLREMGDEDVKQTI